ncbi:hypothetical protein Tco_1265400 [Tanacetum coccineum]
MGLWYSKDSGFELIAYSDADHAGCKDDCKNTSGGLQFLGEKIVNWSSKKQDYTAMSIADAEYVSLYACCEDDDGGRIIMVAAAVKLPEWRVAASKWVDRIDPVTRRNIEARRKNPAGKVFRRWRDGGGGGRPVAGMYGRGERDL